MKKTIVTAVIVTAVATSGMIEAASVPANTHNIQNVQSPTTIPDERGYWDSITINQKNSTEDTITFSYETEQIEKEILKIEVYWRDEQELTSSGGWIPAKKENGNDQKEHKGEFIISGLKPETTYDVYVYIYFKDYWSTYTGGQAQGTTEEIETEAHRPIIEISEPTTIGATYAEVDVQLEIPTGPNQEDTIVKSMRVINENNEILAIVDKPKEGSNIMKISGLKANKENLLTLVVVWNDDMHSELDFAIQTKQFDANVPIINYSKTTVFVSDTSATVQYQYSIPEHNDEVEDTIIKAVNVVNSEGEVKFSSKDPELSNGTIKLTGLDRYTDYNYKLQLVYNGNLPVEQELIFKTSESSAEVPIINIEEIVPFDNDNYSATLSYKIDDTKVGYEDPDIKLIEAIDEDGNILGVQTNGFTGKIVLRNLTPNKESSIHLRTTYGASYGDNKTIESDSHSITMKANAKIAPIIEMKDITDVGINTATINWNYEDINNDTNGGELEINSESFKLITTSKGVRIDTVKVINSNDEELLVTGLSANTDYIFSIVYDDNGLSSESNSMSIKTLKENATPPTAEFEIDRITSTSIDILYQIKIDDTNTDHNTAVITSIQAVNEKDDPYVVNEDNSSLTGSMSLTGLKPGKDYFVALLINYENGSGNEQNYITNGTIVTTSLDKANLPKAEYSFTPTGIFSGFIDFEITLDDNDSKYKAELKTINILFKGWRDPISTVDLTSTPGKLSGLIEVDDLEGGKINLLQAELVFNNGVEDVSYIRNLEAETDKKIAIRPMFLKRSTYIKWVNETDAIVNYEMFLPENDGTYDTTKIESIVVRDMDTLMIVGVSSTNDLEGTITLASISSYSELNLRLEVTWNGGLEEFHSLALEGLSLQWWAWFIIIVATVLTFGFVGMMIWWLMKHNKKNKKEISK